MHELLGVIKKVTCQFVTFPQKPLTENHVCVYMKQTPASIETYQLVGSRILT